jgi:hypothetical protein
VAKAPEILPEHGTHFFSDLTYETQLFLKLAPSKISSAFAAMKKIGYILQGTLQITSQVADRIGNCFRS